MPIYEYKCRQCGHLFEHLARTLGAAAPRCPRCGATRPVKQFSSFSTSVIEVKEACETCTGSAGRCSTGTCPYAN